LHVRELLILGSDNRDRFVGISQESNVREDVLLLNLLDCVSYPVSRIENLSTFVNIGVQARTAA